MLGKLFKHDMAALSRVLVPLHLAALGVAVLAAVCGLAGGGLQEAASHATGAAEDLLNMFSGFAAFAGGLCLFLVLTLALATFLAVVHRFYKNLFTDEGYLTLTLPATANQIVLSKVLAGAFWLIIDFIVVFVAVVAVLFAIDVLTHMLMGDRWWSGMTFSYLTSGGGPWLSLAEGAAQGIAWMLAAYASLCLGSAAARHKVAAAVGAFLLIAVGVGIATALLNVAAFTAISAFAPALSSAHFDPYGPTSRFIGQAAMLALAAASYAVCVWRLKRHVNLA